MAITYRDGKVLYEGAVLSTSLSCERVMSDIYADVGRARVWDAEKGRVESVTYAYYFELGDNNGVAVVDATDEVKALSDAYYAGGALGAAYRSAEHAAGVAEREAAKAAAVAAKRADLLENAPKVGDSVEAKREGRGCPKGTKGIVFWAGWSKRHDASWRVGFKDAAGLTYWMSATGVKVVERASPDAAKPAAPAPAPAVECRLAKGDVVVVSDERLTSCGMVGRIIWIGADRFTGAPRVGVKASDGGVVWLAADDVRAA